MMHFDEHDALTEAITTGMKSPCAKSKRGVVIFVRNYGVLNVGWNHPPDPFECDGTPACRMRCAKWCVHAEQHALRRVEEWWSHPRQREVLHVKVVNGAAVPSGPPSCIECSKILCDDLRIDAIWLLHEDGLRAYSRVEFHRKSLEHHGLVERR